jgi:putative ABC transport system permease protein
MKIPLKYSVRNLMARRLTTALTVGGVALVVFVFAGITMMAYGLQKTLVSSGSPENAVVVRQSSGSEMASYVTREQTGIIKSLPNVAIDSDGQPLVEGESVAIINKDRRGEIHKMANITIRGIGPKSMTIRKSAKLVEGRMFALGSTELIAGKKAAARFQGCGLGESIIIGNITFTVVGLFESNGSASESEVWGDVNLVMPAIGRGVYSSVIFRMKDPGQFEQMRNQATADPRMAVDIKPEDKYYDDQTKSTTMFIKGLGYAVSIIFSLGAIIGAMITMYGAVANRTREIATMRALGFRRRNILSAFLIEAIVIALVGGAIGLLASSFLQVISISTINFDTFSEIAFNFALSPSIIITVMIFALVMGIVGGFLPAVRASRIKIIEALRAE